MEILVVISIIGILMALGIPAYESAQRKTYLTACASNLRQIIAATNLAAADSSGRYPNMHGYAWEQGEIWIADALAPYLGGSAGDDPGKVLRCPAAERNMKQAWLIEPQYSHYRYNIWNAQNRLPQYAYSNAMVFLDTTWDNWQPAVCAHTLGKNDALINVAYADGHIGALDFEEFKKQSAGGETDCDLFAKGWKKQ